MFIPLTSLRMACLVITVYMIFFSRSQFWVWSLNQKRKNTRTQKLIPKPAFSAVSQNVLLLRAGTVSGFMEKGAASKSSSCRKMCVQKYKI